MTSITPSIVFDLVQVGAGVQIKNRQNDETYFVLKFEKKGGLFRRRNVTTIHRAPIDTKGTLPHHFAQWDKKKLEIVKKMPKGSHEKPGISKTYKIKDFMQKRPGSGLLNGWVPRTAAVILRSVDHFVASADTFSVDHKAYKLVKSAGRTLEVSKYSLPASSFSHKLILMCNYPAAFRRLRPSNASCAFQRAF